MRIVMPSLVSLVLVVASCSRKEQGGGSAVAPTRTVAASVEDSVAVESIRLDLEGRENALGAACEVALRNSSERAVEKRLRFVYLSHTGAELLRADCEEEEWTAIRLEGGERKVVTQECPFYTAREARVELR